MFKISEFSRFTRVSVKMLRHYDEIGLLRPAHIDPVNNYRYYSADQLPRLNRIIALKDLGFSLSEIGKYNQPTSEPKRSKDTSDKIKGLANTLAKLADQIGHAPSQVAINWVRQQPGNIIPIIGARHEKQLKDNLGCLEFQLSADQLGLLGEASPIDLGFPRSFLESDHVHSLIFGETFPLIDRK